MFRVISASVIVFLLGSTAFAQPGLGRGRGQGLRLRERQCPQSVYPIAPAPATRPADNQSDLTARGLLTDGAFLWQRGGCGANCGRCPQCPAWCARGCGRMGDASRGPDAQFGRRGAGRQRGLCFRGGSR